MLVVRGVGCVNEATSKLNDCDDHDLISREDKEREETKTNSSLVELIRTLLGDC